MNHKNILLLILLILLPIIFYTLFDTFNYKKKYDKIQLRNYNNIKNNNLNINETIKTGYNFQHGSENMSRDYNKAEEIYKRSIINGSDKAIVYLANLYHDGSDKHDIQVKKALYYYNLALQKGFVECLLDIGDIYLWGLSDIKPDKSLAKQCYNLLIKYGNNELKLKAQDRITQMEDEEDNYSITDHINHSNFSTLNENEIINNLFNTQPYDKSIFSNNSGNYSNNNLSLNDINLYDLRTIDKKTFDDLDKSIHERIQLQKNNEIQNTYQDNTNEIRIIEPDINFINLDRIRNDHQNVHDHVVNKTLKKSISNLKDSTHMFIDKPKSLKDIREMINSENIDNIKKNDAIKTLDYIEKKNKKLSSINMSETDALNLVWNRIHDVNNRDNVKNLQNNLINELAECNEPKDLNDENSKKTQVCTTGRFTRIIDTLNLCDYDNAVKIMPKNALNQELMNKASKLREDMIKTENNEIQEAINNTNPDETQTKLVDDFTNKFKANLLETYNKEYVNEGLISKEILKTEVDKWIDHI